MSKKKEIEAMSELMCNNTSEDRMCNFKTCSDCETKQFARLLYDAGYRKQSDVANEIFEEIEKILVRPENTYGIVFYHCSKQSYDKLKNKYIDGNTTNNL